MVEILDVSIGSEGAIFDKRSCDITEVGATVQAMIDEVVKNDGAFDEIIIHHNIDDDELPEDIDEPLTPDDFDGASPAA